MAKIDNHQYFQSQTSAFTVTILSKSDRFPSLQANNYVGIIEMT